jgi:hypothetical protein
MAMRKLGLALAFLLGLQGPWLGLIGLAQAQVGPPNQIQCNKAVNFTGNAALQQILALQAGQSIYICGWHVTSTSGTTTTFQLEYGTGSNCGTGTQVLTPPLNVTLSAPSADHIDYASMQTPAGQALCVNAPATVTGIIWVSQF